MTETSKDRRDLQIFIERVPRVVSPWIQGSPFVTVSGLERSSMRQSNQYFVPVNAQNNRSGIEQNEWSGPSYIAIANSAAVEGIDFSFSFDDLLRFIDKLAQNQVGLRECADFGTSLFESIFQRSVRDIIEMAPLDNNITERA